MSLRRFLIGIFALIALSTMSVACVLQKPTGQEVTLFFYSENDLQNATFEHPVIVTRTVAADSGSVMDATLKLLFAGPTVDERAKGAMTSSDLTRLSSFYLGFWAEDGVAVVNFRREALEILNSAAARQFMAKEPMRRTLLQFPGINDVKYAIDGVVFEEWDA